MKRPDYSTYTDFSMPVPYGDWEMYCQARANGIPHTKSMERINRYCKSPLPVRIAPIAKGRIDYLKKSNKPIPLSVPEAEVEDMTPTYYLKKLRAVIEGQVPKGEGKTIVDAIREARATQRDSSSMRGLKDQARIMDRAEIEMIGEDEGGYRLPSDVVEEAGETA